MNNLNIHAFTYKYVLTNVDLNTIKTFGIYYAGNNLTNSPVTSPWGVLLVLGRSINTDGMIQLLIDQYGTIWARRVDDGSWKKSSNS